MEQLCMWYDDGDDDDDDDDDVWCCDRLFSDGLINWGRIIVLLCFGYRVIVAAVKQGLRLHLIFAQLIQFVVEFFIKEKLARWVAAQGGWVSFLLPSYLFGSIISTAAWIDLPLLLELIEFWWSFAAAFELLFSIDLWQ